MTRFFSLSILSIALAMTACSKSSGPREINGVRELTEPERQILVVDSPAERFRLPTQMAGGGAASAPASSDLPFVWATPEGWALQAGVPMRDLSFTFGDNAEGECYLSRLPGAGGGLAPNVNRWRGQMGLEPMTDEEIAALPKKPMFGLEGTFLDVNGTFSGMGGGAGKENYRMLGVILASEGGAVFVKMTGPADLVAANEAKFDAFCASLQPRQ